MQEYLDFLQYILKNGRPKHDRTGTGTISIFGYQMRFDLKKGFPLVTTKKIHFKSVVGELLWFISGSTNIHDLVVNNIRIWNEWPFKSYQASPAYQGESMGEFVEKIKQNPAFAKKWGDLGPVYGRQWRNFNGYDQLQTIISQIKTSPSSRRHIVSAWNPPQIRDMALPPCHLLFQFYVNEQQELSCQLYQRSADAFLGVPFNIASYSLLTMMVAQECGLKLGEFIHTIGDGHIYENHLAQVRDQLSRTPKPLPTVWLNPAIKSVVDFKFEDIVLENYTHWPLIKAKVAV